MTAPAILFATNTNSKIISIRTMQKRSNSAFKLLSMPADDRIISNYILPYNKSYTVYSQNNFSDWTISLCENNRNIILNSLNIYKVIILGDVSAGKTCIINRFCHKMFETNYKATIGVDFEVEKFQILGIPFNLQIWDTAGQERFKSIAQAYYRSSHVIMIVFDLTNIFSLRNANVWLHEAKKACESTKPFIFLIGSKKDLLSAATYKIVEKHAVRAAKCINAEYWAVSSKTGENISNLFNRIACLTFDENIPKQFNEINERIIGDSEDFISFKKKKSHSKTNKCSGSSCV